MRQFGILVISLFFTYCMLGLSLYAQTSYTGHYRIVPDTLSNGCEVDTSIIGTISIPDSTVPSPAFIFVNKNKDSMQISFNGGTKGIFALPIFPGRHYIFHDSTVSGAPGPDVEWFYLQILDGLSSFRAMFRLTSCYWSIGQVFPHQWTLNQTHSEGILDSFPVVNRVQDLSKIVIQQIDIYPNPSSGTTSISCTMQKTSYIHLNIFNELGKDIMTVYDGMAAEGPHNFSFKLQPGMYYARMETAEGVATKKIVVE